MTYSADCFSITCQCYTFKKSYLVTSIINNWLLKIWLRSIQTDCPYLWPTKFRLSISECRNPSVSLLLRSLRPRICQELTLDSQNAIHMWSSATVATKREPGVYFTNILFKAFLSIGPKSSKKDSQVLSFFLHFQGLCSQKASRKIIGEIDPRFQFHQQFTRSFYFHRAQKHKKTLMTWLFFVYFGYVCTKCWWNWLQVSISSTIYKQLFQTNVFCAAFIYLQFGFIIFCQRILS